MTILKDDHWVSESYKQRMTIKVWKQILLDDKDHIIFHGVIRQLRSKSLGVGIVEIYKESINEVSETPITKAIKKLIQSYQNTPKHNLKEFIDQINIILEKGNG